MSIARTAGAALDPLIANAVAADPGNAIAIVGTAGLIAPSAAITLVSGRAV